MSDFKILKNGEKAEGLYCLSNKKNTELELAALLDGKRIWTDINGEYAMTIQLKGRFKELELDKEISRLNNIINELEKWLKSIQLTYLRSDNQPVYRYQEVLDKLKELQNK